MAELPGWDRHRLANADPRDVEAARLLVYARARRPEIRADLDGQIEQLELAGLDGDAHRLRAAHIRNRHLAATRAEKATQAALRAALELDVTDDEADEDLA